MPLQPPFIVVDSWAGLLGAVILALGILPGTVSPAWAASSLLTEEEAAWLKEHPVLRLAPDPHFPPIEFFDGEARYQGLVADYYHLIGERLGVRFEIVRAADWNQVLHLARTREVDIVGAAQKTPERSGYLLFSQPIIDIPNVIITGVDTPGPLDLAALGGRRVAVTQGNALHEYLREHFPGIEIVPVVDDLSALRDVSFKRADATVVNLAIASYLIEKEGIANLRVAGDSGRNNALHIATRSDWPMLNQIMSKALASLDEEDRRGIAAHWIKLHGTPDGIDPRLWRWLLGVVLVLLAIFLVVVMWNRTLRRRVEAQTRALAEELRERGKIEADLRRSEERYREVFNATNDAIFVHDAQTGLVLEVNRRALEMYGATRQQMLEADVSRLSEGTPPYAVEDAVNWIRRAVAEGPQVFDWRARRLDGSTFWVEVALRSSMIAGRPCVLAVVRDIGERKEAEDRLAHYAMHDPLTGLPNRRLVSDRVGQALSFARRHGEAVAILFIDLDRFKAINDTFGHGVGDEVLLQVGARLKGCVRESDTVGRLGGDEFLSVLSGLHDKRHVSRVAQTMLDAISRPYHVGGNDLSLSVSIGIALFPQDGGSIEELVRNADMAMLAAKTSGRRNFRFYDARLDAEAAERLALQTRLQKAFEQGTFSSTSSPRCC
ncbi:MAG: diguanylate cyclase domain-containing protein [Pseudomonadota bacterium]